LQVDFQFVSADGHFDADNVDESDDDDDAIEAPGINSLESAASAASVRVAIAKVKPILAAALPAPLTWHDALPALESCSNVEEIEKVVDDPNKFFNGLQGKMAVRMAIARARSKVEPQLTPPLTWADLSPILAELETLEELNDAVTNVRGFLARMQQDKGALGAKLIFLQKKPSIEAKLPWPITWDDILPAFYQIQDPADATSVANDPEALIKKMTRSSKPEFGVPWATRLRLLQAKEELSDKLMGIFCVCPSEVYEPAVPALKDAKSKRTSLGEKSTGRDDGEQSPATPKTPATPGVPSGPPSNLYSKEKKGDNCKNCGRAPSQHTQAYTFDEALEIFSLLPKVKDVKSAIEKPEKKLKQIEEGDSPASCRLVMLKARPLIEPKLPGNLAWDDVRPALEGVRDVNELRALAKDPAPLIERLTRGPSVSAQNTATGTTILIIRPDLMPPAQQRMHSLFFDKRSPANLVSVFTVLAGSLFGMIKNGEPPPAARATAASKHALPSRCRHHPRGAHDPPRLDVHAARLHDRDTDRARHRAQGDGARLQAAQGAFHPAALAQADHPVPIGHVPLLLLGQAAHPARHGGAQVEQGAAAAEADHGQGGRHRRQRARRVEREGRPGRRPRVGGGRVEGDGRGGEGREREVVRQQDGGRGEGRGR
jgi:hypothetical protein